MDYIAIFLNSLILILLFPSCLSVDAITINRSVTGSNFLLSQEGIFALGFFSPGKSKYRYLGIWYHKLPGQTVVWVANRNKPINDSSGFLSMSPNGNLVLYKNHDREFPLWSTNVSMKGTEGCIAQLLDSGNLVLVQNENKRIVWQSFDYPTDTMLPSQKIGLDRRTGLDRFLTSWRSVDDPRTDDWSYKLNPNGCPQFFLYKGLTPYWRTTPWPWDPAAIPGYVVVSANNQDEIYYTLLSNSESLFSRTVVSSGLVQRLIWDSSSNQWREARSEPKYIYGHCGAYSILNANNVDGLECMCLPGYEPKSLNNWNVRDSSAGCVRKRRQTTTMCRNGEGFVKVESVKVPDTSIAALMNTSLSSTGCEQLCLRNCSCKAYANLDIQRKGFACLTWFGELMDTIKTAGGRDMYVRVDAIEFAEYKKKRRAFLQKKGMLVILILSVAFMIFSIVLCAYLRLRKKRKTKESRQLSDLPIFSLRTISAATNNFSPANKLGQGGFGSVYMGRLDNGQEIAVKRLSQSSEQGLTEFKNEVMLIVRLQHRNLVKILGCCIQQEERMLVYEYLPNKSLDSFIFDQRRKSTLNWSKRFDIIVGIARGILYLHHDSRLRIIHRDLKTSNVLLDIDMNPKISDFGMARIFRGDEVQDKTNRVVGTYGYMAPEYVVFGRFSTKSDVFSFGVILLEIVSGKKSNTSFPESASLNLIGHVWELWSKDRALDIVDSSLTDLSLLPEVFRCIQIGLLCVQEDATNRPTMSTVVLMLNGETALPYPKQPAFILTRTSNNPSTSEGGNSSVNEVTITNIESR